jgi:hypothetical protein
LHALCLAVWLLILGHGRDLAEVLRLAVGLRLLLRWWSVVYPLRGRLLLLWLAVIGLELSALLG